ncbi:hypothetical protein QYM36_002827 [Artemia franciscana]|uniref:Uncharacterized protein n=1 Tax=Artemia franciscana TaxID=6661 RepID=A0AA88IDT3_ARTSF|nr:hypothetical protein QYM36_002827 [Artemia franciscana]
MGLFKTSYTPSKKLQSVSELTEEEKELIQLSTRIDLIEFKNVCSHHSYYFLNVTIKGEKYQTVCIDPLKKHKKPIKNAVKIEESYKDLIKMLVCNVENNECMLRHCDNCLSYDALIEYLTAKLSEDYDLEEEIIISQCFNTDRTEMVKQSISVESCISSLSKSVENLIPHSYITKSQSKTFKKLKEDTPLNTAIVVMDFRENYSYTIQSEILSYHWNRGGCTIHPVGLY